MLLDVSVYMATKITNACTVVAKMPECYLGSGQWRGPKRGGHLIYQVAISLIIRWQEVKPGGELDGCVDIQERIFTTGVCSPKISQGQIPGFWEP